MSSMRPHKTSTMNAHASSDTNINTNTNSNTYSNTIKKKKKKNRQQKRRRGDVFTLVVVVVAQVLIVPVPALVLLSLVLPLSSNAFHHIQPTTFRIRHQGQSFYNDFSYKYMHSESRISVSSRSSIDRDCRDCCRITSRDCRSRSRSSIRLNVNKRNHDHDHDHETTTTHGNGKSTKLYFSNSDSSSSSSSGSNDYQDTNSILSSRLSPPSSQSQSKSPPAIKSTILPYNYKEDSGDEECPEESCLLSFLPDLPDKFYSKGGSDDGSSSSSSPSSSSSSPSALQSSSPYSTFLFETILNPSFFIPVLTPILAYFTYDDVASCFNACIDTLNYKRTWVPVDGGNYQAKIIAPAINGICIPAISILFATLISNTVATLRQRQMDIHTNLNTEAGELRLLSSMVDSFPTSVHKMRCYVYLTQYTNRLIGESSDKITLNSVEFQGSTDSEMNGFVNVLNELTCFPSLSTSTSSSASASTTESKPIVPPPPILSESYGAVVRLNSLRSSRITSLQSTFPSLHYSILTALAGSICLAFLIETNQDILIFLNAIQLRILWTMLIGTFSALAVVCYDLSGPFRGQYQISNAVYQLMTIRDALKAAMSLEEDVEDANANASTNTNMDADVDEDIEDGNNT